MRRKFNVKLLAWVLAGLGLTGGALHLVHGFQVQHNAEALLGQAERALEGGQNRQAASYFQQYLAYRPTDNDALARYALLLDRLASSPATHYRAWLLLEKALRRQPERAELREESARMAIGLYRFANAARHLQILLEATPGKADLEYALGWCQESAGDYGPAAVSYRQALRHDPKNLAGYRRLADLEFFRLERPRQAGKVLDDMVSANPKSADAYIQRARYQQRVGSGPEAWPDLLRAKALAPENVEVLLAGAELAQARGDLVAARLWVQSGLKVNPGDAHLYQLLALLERRAHHPVEAAAILRRGLEKAPNSRELLLNLADLLADEGEVTDAAKVIGHARRAGAEPAALDYLEARLLARGDRWDEAQRLVEQARGRLQPSSPWQAGADLLLARCFGRLGDPRQQAAASLRALAFDPSWPAASKELGAALLALGQPGAAATELRRASHASDSPAETWALLARAALQEQRALPAEQRNWQEAEAALDNAAKVRPEATEHVILRAELLRLRGQGKDALELLDRACRQDPDAPTLWAARADLERQQGKQATAFSLLAQGGREMGEPLPLRLAWARYWAQCGGELGRQALQQLARTAGQLPAYQATCLYREVAEDLYRLGDWRAAQQLWLELAHRLPTDLASRSRLLELALERGQDDVLKRLVDDLRRLEGDDGVLWRYGAAARLIRRAQQGQRSLLAEARQLLRGVGRRQYGWTKVSLLEAAADEVEGNTEAAVQHYLQALDQGDKNRHVIARTVRLLTRRRRYHQADQVLRKAEAQGAAGPELLRLGAEVALELQDWERALALARQAVPATARDYRDHLWQARLLAAAGRPEEAQAELRRAVALAGAAPEPWAALVRHLVSQGQQSQADRALEEARHRVRADLLPMVEALCAEALGDLARAESLYRKNLVDHPEDFLALRAAADFFLRTHKAARAEPMLRGLLDPANRAPDEITSWARRRLAVGLAEDSRPGAFQEALALLDKTVGQAKPSAEDVCARARVLATRTNRRAEAVALLEQLRQDRELSPDDQFLLARLYEAEGRPAQARDLMLDLLDVKAQNPTYLSHYVRVLLRRGELAEAQSYLERLAQVEPQSLRTRELQALVRKARTTP